MSLTDGKLYDNDIRLIVNHLTVDVTIFPIVEKFYRIRQKQASRKKFFSLVSSKIDPLRLKDRVFNKILSAANNLGHFEFSEILKPLLFGKLTEGKARTVLIRQCIYILQH